MEHILHLYELPYDRKRPLICVDERPCQLIGDVLVPLPMQPDKPKREGYQYKRHGVCTVFMALEPLTGWRFVMVRKRRTKKDYARFMQAVADHFPEAEKIMVVQDNLNTHNPGSFYQLFSPTTAFALAQRFEMHYTPTKASWLNMVKLNCLSSRSNAWIAGSPIWKLWNEKCSLGSLSVINSKLPLIGSFLN